MRHVIFKLVDCLRPYQTTSINSGVGIGCKTELSTEVG